MMLNLMLAISLVGDISILTVGVTDSVGILIDTETVQSDTDAVPMVASSKSEPHRTEIAYIAIGINDYKSNSIPDLKYAVNDAVEFKKMVENQKVDTSKIKISVYLLTDSLATGANILSTIRDSARDADMLVILLSGHSVCDKSGKFCPYDVGRGSDCINLSSIMGLIGDKKLVIFADCSFNEIYGDRLSFFDYLSIARGDIWIFSYPQCGMEKPDLKHGILSYYLLKAFSGEADYNEDGVISTLELALYFNSIDSDEVDPILRPAALVGHPDNSLPVFYLSKRRKR